MSGWSPLWSMIVESSLWEEPDYVCKVFVTMLALKDHDHVVRLDAYKLAKKAHKTEAETLEAIRILESPDTRRISPQEFNGRRIEKVEDGWLVLNGEKYKEMMARIHRRQYQAEWQRGYRERQKNKGSTNGNGTLSTSDKITLEKEMSALEEELKRLKKSAPYPDGDERIGRMSEVRVEISKIRNVLKTYVKNLVG